MEFHTRHTYWDFMRHTGRSQDECAIIAQQLAIDMPSKLQVESERRWLKAERPYYCLYPAIAKMLMNTKLSIDCSHIQMPLKEVLIRLPVGASVLDSYPLRTVLVCMFDEAHNKTGVRGRGLGIWCDRGEMSADGCPMLDYQTMLLCDGVTLEESVNSYLDTVDTDCAEALDQILRIVVGITFLAKDPDICIPDVLARDRHKTLTDVEIDRARRRGKIGWVIGQDVEVAPHVRRPHMAFRWTGPGGEVLKLVPVKGSVIHRKKVQSVPTGYES